MLCDTHAMRAKMLIRETEPDWVKDLETDVKEECTKFGQVEHIHVNEDSLVSDAMDVDETKMTDAWYRVKCISSLPLWNQPKRHWRHWMDDGLVASR